MGQHGKRRYVSNSVTMGQDGSAWQTQVRIKLSHHGAGWVSMANAGTYQTQSPWCRVGQHGKRRYVSNSVTMGQGGSAWQTQVRIKLSHHGAGWISMANAGTYQTQSPWGRVDQHGKRRYVSNSVTMVQGGSAWQTQVRIKLSHHGAGWVSMANAGTYQTQSPWCRVDQHGKRRYVSNSVTMGQGGSAWQTQVRIKLSHHGAGWVSMANAGTYQTQSPWGRVDQHGKRRYVSNSVTMGQGGSAWQTQVRIKLSHHGAGWVSMANAGTYQTQSPWGRVDQHGKRRYVSNSVTMGQGGSAWQTQVRIKLSHHGAGWISMANAGTYQTQSPWGRVDQHGKRRYVSNSVTMGQGGSAWQTQVGTGIKIVVFILVFLRTLQIWW